MMPSANWGQWAIVLIATLYERIAQLEAALLAARPPEAEEPIGFDTAATKPERKPS